MLKSAILLAPFAAVLLATLPAAAFMGDSLAQTLATYGQPIASTGKPGQATSTKTFAVSGLQILCGYLDGKVAMETIVNPQRDLLPPEVEALLRNEAQNQNWKLPNNGNVFINGTYQRLDGVTAKVTGNKIEIISSAWITAVAKDQALDKAASPASPTKAP